MTSNEIRMVKRAKCESIDSTIEILFDARGMSEFDINSIKLKQNLRHISGPQFEQSALQHIKRVGSRDVY
jgi:hypothetical protein